METTAVEGQSLFDLAVQAGGAVEAVFGLAAGNDLSITAAVEAGQAIRTGDPQNKDIARYYGGRNIRPATYSAQEAEILSGIGYMSIGDNNIVL